MHFAKIKRIKYLGKRKTCDLSVNKYHNFILDNGIITHNSGKSSFGIQLCREWCSLLGVPFNTRKHIVYSNAQLTDRLNNSERFMPILCDEAVLFASAAEWAKLENRELRKRLAQIRTRHLFFVLCWPMKVNKIEKTYLDSFVNYWIHIFKRGTGAIFVKDVNPVSDGWKLSAFKDVGSFTEFTKMDKVKKKLSAHPNFWHIITVPKPSEEFYKRYLVVREKNVYNSESMINNLSRQDVHKAILIKVLQDIMVRDSSLSMKRLLLHIKNEYGFEIKEGELKIILADVEALVNKLNAEKYNLKTFQSEESWDESGTPIITKDPDDEEDLNEGGDLAKV